MNSSVSAKLALFYVEPHDDRWIRFDRFPRRAARWLLRRDRLSGYRQLARTLYEGLRRAGVRCCFNRYRQAQRNPDMTIGVLGKNSLLEQWHPENPIVFGPCMLDHPKDRSDLFERFNAKFYLVPSQWVYDMFEPYFGKDLM